MLGGGGFRLTLMFYFCHLNIFGILDFGKQIFDVKQEMPIIR